MEQLLFDKIIAPGNQSDQDESPISVVGVRLERSCPCLRAALCDYVKIEYTGPRVFKPQDSIFIWTLLSSPRYDEGYQVVELGTVLMTFHNWFRRMIGS